MSSSISIDPTRPRKLGRVIGALHRDGRRRHVDRGHGSEDLAFEAHHVACEQRAVLHERPDGWDITPASTHLSFYADFGISIGPVLFVVWVIFLSRKSHRS